MTVTNGRFEWDDNKNFINFEKHGIYFDDVLSVFDDPLFFEIHDEKHSSIDEDRFLGFGRINDMLIITTCFTERERIRLISARKATSSERRLYYEYNKR